MARRVLIVGAGVVGLSAALFAAREGFDVTVVDESAAPGDGCSYGNAGMIVPSHFVPLAAPGMVGRALRWMWDPESPFYLRPRLDPGLARWAWLFWRAATPRRAERSAPILRDLHLASRRLFEEWAAEWDDGFGLTRRGLLMLCRTPEGLHAEAKVAAQAKALGVDAEMLTAAEAQALEPGLRMEVAGAVRVPLDGHLSPERLMAALRRAVEGAGARVVQDVSVKGWRLRGGRVDAAVTSAGEVEAEEHVLAAGVWSTDLARGLGLRLPMEAGKGLSLTLPRPRCLPSHCAILAEAYVAVTPMGDALRFAGTMELAGLDRGVGPARVRGIVRAVARYLPDFTEADFAGVPVWSGLRPCSPDGLPYVGRVGRFANLSVATGHAMLGVSLGPITGRLVADGLAGRAPAVDVAALAPDRHA
jgi:D-amino-acid dehydrogenase